MSETTIQHKNQEIEVVTRRRKPRVRPSRRSPAPSPPTRTDTPNLSTNLPRLSSAKEDRS